MTATVAAQIVPRPPARRGGASRLGRLRLRRLLHRSLLLFNIAPIFFGAYVGFTKWGIFGKPKWVGLQNFTDAFKDEFVGIAFKNTILYGLIIVPCVVVIGFTFALYVHQRWPLSSLARTLFFSPYVVSATVIGLVWVWMFDTSSASINHYLAYFGIADVPWLTSTNWSLIGVSIASVWWDLGLAFVLFLAALQDVPRDLYEAAEVDGASRWQRLWMVILPQLRPVISLVVTLQMISSLRIFSQVYVMTNGGPGFELVLGDLLHVHRGDLPPALRLCLGGGDPAVPDDHRHHHRPRARRPRALAMAASFARRINRRLQPFGLRLTTLPVWLIGLAIALHWAMPFVWMISTSLKFPPMS
jgi:multiple sugar transport system permease protein